MPGGFFKKIKPFFKWYDAWVGFYWDRATKTLYFCPVPCLGVEVDLSGLYVPFSSLFAPAPSYSVYDEGALERDDDFFVGCSGCNKMLDIRVFAGMMGTYGELYCHECELHLHRCVECQTTQIPHPQGEGFCIDCGGPLERVFRE